jgi:hypothetical protein
MHAAARKASAYLALLVFAGSLGLASLPSRHMLVGLDADCASPLFIGPQTTQVTQDAPSRTAPAEHCVLCHWLRAAGNSKPALVVCSAPSLVQRESSRVADQGVPRDAVYPDAPSRAPPQFVSL